MAKGNLVILITGASSGIGNASMRFLHTILPDRWFDALITFLFYKFG